MAGNILVVGSINVDFSAYVRSLPSRGETVAAEKFLVGFGGKGANQAVAAARLGSRVSFIGRVGDDPYGREAIRALRKSKVRVSAIHATPRAQTGSAFITVDRRGENRIVIVGGANAAIRPSDLRRNGRLFERADCILLQLEVPLDVVEKAGRLARRAGALVILNPAPVPAGNRALLRSILRLVDVLVPNETEFEALGRAASSVPEVIVTEGPRGATRIRRPRKKTRFPAVRAKAVDTTGAGDAFVGALAHALASGAAMEDAIRLSNAYAASSIERPGTQPSYL